MNELRGITVRNPYAKAIAVGAKRVENRGQMVRWRGEVAIHAGRTWHPDGNRDSRILQLLRGEDPSTFPAGAIIAVALLVDCHEAVSVDPMTVCCGPWAQHTYNGRPAWHLVLANIRQLPRPVPARGALQIGWRVPADVALAVRSQLTLSEV